MSTTPLHSGAGRVRVCEGPLGKGIHARRPLETGEPILEFSGPILTHRQVIALGDAQAYALQIGPDRYFDPEPLGRFANHSCVPNAGIKNDRVLVALQPIATGEEVRFDFSTTMSENYWTLACRCQESKCRGVIRDFHLIPPALQAYYIERGIVQGFIVQEWDQRQLRLAEAHLLLGVSAGAKPVGSFQSSPAAQT
jgi:uncharacterized protein